LYLHTSTYGGKGEAGNQGKQGHMAHAGQELSTLNKVPVTRETTLLIDDDIRNIRIALKSQTAAVQFHVNDVDKYNFVFPSSRFTLI
jgi:hypothetical protein